MIQTQITKVTGREILDSRGNPTIEAQITLSDGSTGIGSSPSGASTGLYEALELRDKDKSRYGGKGVLTGVGFINTEISEALLGQNANDTYKIDGLLKGLDGTHEKKRLGANTTLAVSIACARAASKAYHMPLHEFLGGISGNTLPTPMMNILNGGAHASNNIDIQEFMIFPSGIETFPEKLRCCTEIYHTLASLLKKEGLSTAVGDEGGFAPTLSKDTEALDFLVAAIEKAGYEPSREVFLTLDCAASEWKGERPDQYILPKSKKEYSTQELIDFYSLICDRYPIASIEDPLDEEDWDGWQEITLALGNQVQLVGDDLFVTNTNRLAKGIAYRCGNAILIKPNQIGTLSETIEAIKLARKHGFATIASHRSGETEDTAIADLSVGLNMGQIKTGAPCRSERVAKYNRLLRIDEALKGR